MSQPQNESSDGLTIEQRGRTRSAFYRSDDDVVKTPVGNDDPFDLENFILPDATAQDMKDANSRQVGGDHYRKRRFQHWDMVAMFDLDYFQGQITKYVLRWKDKNGIQDLEKAQHFLEKYIELEKRKTEGLTF